LCRCKKLEKELYLIIRKAEIDRPDFVVINVPSISNPYIFDECFKLFDSKTNKLSSSLYQPGFLVEEEVSEDAGDSLLELEAVITEDMKVRLDDANVFVFRN